MATLADTQFTKYNGQDVVTDPKFMANLDEATKSYNTATGKNLTSEQYDRQINPTTAGARWGGAPPPTSPTSPSTGGGLLSPEKPNVMPATATQAQAVGYTPTKQTVSDLSTVQNQLANITASGSALNTLAEANATKAANRRGLLNSSIAVGEGQKAVLQSALPIAQQDANTYAGTDAANASYLNRASEFAAAAKNQASGLNAQLGTQTSQFNSNANLQFDLAKLQSNTQLSLADKDAATKKILQQMDANTRLEIAKLDNGSKTQLAQIDADNRQLLQTNISAANLYSQYVNNLTTISLNDKLDASAKQTAANNQLAALQASLKSIGEVSKLDLSKYWQDASQPSFPPPTYGGTTQGEGGGAGAGAGAMTGGGDIAGFVPGYTNEYF